MTQTRFMKGERYTRKDIFRILEIIPEPTGGPWFTGYTSHGEEYYAFVNIQTAGRTGHNYGDHWLDNETLYWYGKNGSRLGQPSIMKMLDPSTNVHFFTRDDARDPAFIYQGIGRAEMVCLRTPVEVVWKF